MPIELSTDTAALLRESIKRFVAEHLDQDIGDLKATMMLDYCLKEIGPTVYNKAIADAQRYFETKVVDLEGACYEREFQYWEAKRK
ncbi:MAG: hypothetical protein AMXMBFR57_10150 [Acidimicrobiia bacterium]